MSLGYIGPIPVDFHGDPTFTWQSAANANGMRSASIGGYFDWPVAHQVLELVNNPGRVVTVGDVAGVLDVVWFDDDLLRDLRGWYLIENASINPAQIDSIAGCVPLTINATLVGENRQLVVVRSARARANAYGLAGREILAAPLTPSTAGKAFAVEPGGTVVEREFDAVHAETFFGGDVDSRVLQLRAAAIGTLPDIVLPAADVDGSPPSWVSLRGGDCRAYDVSEGRAVYGPSHPFAEPSDLVLENGPTRWWLGSRGIVPYFTVMVFVDGAWQQCGCVVLADETTGPQLDGARLVTVTPDRVTAALRVRDIGEVFVTLKRGERMLRVQHGSTRAPTVSTTRRIGWLGTPPTVDGLGDAAWSASGRFGGGIALSGDDTFPQFQWPAAATPEAFAVAGFWVPDDDDTAHPTSGMFTIMNAAGAPIVSLHHDGAGELFIAELGDTMLMTLPVSFVGGDAVGFVLRFDDVAGARLTIATPNDGIVQASDSSTDLATSSTFAQLALAGWSVAETEPFGSGPPFGSGGPFGGAISAVHGVLDEMFVFAGTMTDAQAAALATAAAQLADVPASPRPVWYAAFDINGLVPLGDATASGRRVELGDDPIINMRRVLAGLDGIADGTGLFSVRSSTLVTSIDLMAGFATDDAADTAADLHDQLAAASEQETRIR